MSEQQQYTDTAKNLEIMAEELSEIVEICARAAIVKSKIIRFGIEDCHPDKPGVTNRERLELEIGHLNAMVKILVASGVLTQAGIDSGEANKMAKLQHWYDGNPASKKPELVDMRCSITHTRPKPETSAPTTRAHGDKQ